MDYRTATREERAAHFILVATRLHNSFYDYSHVERQYVNGNTKVTIVCPKHGPFQQKPQEHARAVSKGHAANRCPDCTAKSIATTEALGGRFIEKSIAKHGDRYDYSKARYVDAKTKVTLICREHGEFGVRPDNHISVYPTGCPDCARIGHRVAPRKPEGKDVGKWVRRPVAMRRRPSKKVESRGE